jgi:hypothetical protein
MHCIVDWLVVSSSEAQESNDVDVSIINVIASDFKTNFCIVALLCCENTSKSTSEINLQTAIDTL